MNEKIIQEINQKMFKGCPQCSGRKHVLGHWNRISEEERRILKDFPCHLRFHEKKDYVGSFVSVLDGKEITVDVYNFIVRTKTIILDLIEKAREEPQEESLEEQYEQFQIEDEDDLTDS